MADPCLDRQPPTHHFGSNAIDHGHGPGNLVPHRIERLPSFAVPYQIQGPEQAKSTNIPDTWVCLLQRPQLLPEICTHLCGPFYKLKPLHLADGCNRRCKRQRVGLISVSMSEEMILEMARDFFSGRTH